MRTTIAGILLAGGESSRFGSPKMFTIYRDKPFYQWCLEAISPYMNQVSIVTKPSYIYEFTNTLSDEVSVITDLPSVRGKGPLAGMLSAMEHAESMWYFVIPIDVPCMTRHIVQSIINEVHPGVQAVIPVVNNQLQPLIGLYHYSVKSVIQSLLQTNKQAVHRLLAKIHVQTVTISESKPFININNQQDYMDLLHYN